jgi:hypothetical protein
MAPTPSHPPTCLLVCSLPSTLAIKSPADPTNTAADIAASLTMVTTAPAPCPTSSEAPVSSPAPPPQTPSENGAPPVKANTSPSTPAKATPSSMSPASASTQATMATAQAPTGPPAPAPSKASGPDTSLASRFPLNARRSGPSPAQMAYPHKHSKDGTADFHSTAPTHAPSNHSSVKSQRSA